MKENVSSGGVRISKYSTARTVLFMDRKDALKELYPEAAFDNCSLSESAFIIVDMQKADAHEDYGFLRKAREAGAGDSVAYYLNRIKTTLIPNIARLLALFRTTPAEVIYLKIESLTQDGRDRSLEHKRIGVHAPKGSPEAEILEEIAPEGDEIVISKTASGAFNCTNLDYVLRNLGIRTLIVCGVLTNECVESLVRDGADRSYQVIVLEDCCAAISEETHRNALQAMGATYAQIMTSRELEEAAEAMR
jgi:nicotinamidase-related amidase